MAEKLTFSLVSPDRELFHGEVEHVVAPGAEGEFGVLPRHAPFMTTLRPGALRVIDGAGERRFFVNGGLADVTPAGLTVLAEDAVDLEKVSAAEVDSELAAAEIAARDAAPGAEARLSRLRSLRALLG